MKSIFILILVVILNVFISTLVTNQVPAENKDTSEAKSPPLNNYYLKTAKTYFGQEDYTKAIEASELALTLEPDNTEAQALLKESRQLLKEKKEPLGLQCQKQEPQEPQEPHETKAAPPSDIPQLIQSAKTALSEKRYDDAAEMADAILAMDPLNKEGIYIKGKVNDIKHKDITENLNTIKTQETLKGYEHLKESSIPYQDTVRFPAKEQWKGISNRKLPDSDKVLEGNKIRTEQLRLVPNPAGGQFPKVIEDALNTIISFEFLDTPLKDVVVFLREKTNINMVVDTEAGNVSIALRLKDIPLRTALEYILPKGYEYVVEGDIIHIYKLKMEMRVYDVRDILINLDDKEPLEFDITAAATSQIGMKKKESIRTKEPAGRVLDLIELIVTTIEPASWSRRTSVIGTYLTASTGGASLTGGTSPISGQRFTNIPGQGEGSIVARMGHPGDMVVVNTKHVHRQIEGLLASLRSSQNLQVSIESRFISVSDTFFEDLGSNFSKFFSENTKIDTGVKPDGSDIKDLVSGSGLTVNYAILTGSMLKGFIRAVQESKDSEILTSPRITLSNTQRGNIAVVKTTNYVQSTSVSEGIVTPIIGTIPEGTTFDVRPVVGADRKYIYLEVTPSVFQIDSIDSFRFSGIGTGTVVSGAGVGGTNVPPDQIIQLPKVNVSQVSVTVSVPDKGTLMIGGLGSINKTKTVTGIPILSKIPIIKRLFSHDQKDNVKTNLIILLKPTILIREEQEANFFKSDR